MSIGTFVIFGVVLVPLYVVLLGWIFGEPRNYKPVAFGVGVLVGLMLLMVMASVVPIAFRVFIPT